jgi:PAS domain S-box-containing protein
MKNHLLGISIATNILLKELSIEVTLNTCIKVLGESNQVDRCYILKIEKDSIDYCYEWCNTGISSFLNKSNLEKDIYREFPEIYSKFLHDEPIYGLIKECNNASFYKIMKDRNVQSYQFTPVLLNSKLWGWFGFENCNDEKKWKTDEVSSVHLIAKNIALRLKQDKTIVELQTTLGKFKYSRENSKQAIRKFDLETNKISFSFNWLEMVGRTNDEIQDPFAFWRKICHPMYTDQTLLDLENYSKGISDTFEGITRLLHNDGHYIWVKYSGLLIKNKKGKPEKIIGTNIDISDIKEKERQLQLSQEKLRFITDNTTDVLCNHNIDGSYTYVSKSMKEILGYEPIEMINKIAFDFIHPDDIKHITVAHENCIKDSKYRILTYRFRKKDNTYIWLETSSKNILNTENVVIGLQTFSRDVSERIKAEQEIKTALKKERELSEMKSRFVAMASHQFRTPLTVIYSNAELIALKTNHLDKKIVNSIGNITSRIKKEVDRMTELMNNILIFGKYESNKIKKEIKKINLNIYIKTLVDNYFNGALAEGKIQIKIKGKKQVFHTDETLLTHILTNLISNAFKYSAGKSNPLIIVSYLEKEIEIDIIDFGIGIPENEIQYLFTSFFRASNTTTIIGSGLGLVIVKQFTVFLNGKIELKSKENFGTTIKLIFPYEQN